MADRVAQFVINIDGDNGPIIAALQKLKGAVNTTASELERTTSNVELFKGASKSLDESAAALKRVETNAASLRTQIASLREGGQEVGKDLVKGLREADKQVIASTRAFERQQTAVASLQTTLAKAGVDTKRLADEEARLAKETAAAVKAATEQQARQTLGIKSSKDTADAVAKINAAYQTLRTSGTASLRELAEAQSGVLKKTAELRGEQDTLGRSFGAVRAGVLATAAALAGVVAGIREAVDLGRQFERSVAQLGTASNASQKEIAGLAQDVRRLSADLGFDLQEGLKATYDLLRQGVPPGNIIEFLTTADQAAKAAVTDLGTAAKLTGILFRGFGLDLVRTREAMDQAFTLMRTGGATFDELAANLGNLAPLAKRLKIPFDEIAVAIATMTRSGLDAPTAFAQLQQILVRLGDPAVVKKLRDMGIESKGLVSTLQQLADRRLGVTEILDLGTASTKAANGVSALTEDSRKLADALNEVRTASVGAVQAASELFAATDSERIGQLSASFKSLATNIGLSLLPSGVITEQLTKLIQVVDSGVTKVREFGLQGGGIAAAFAQAIPVFGAAAGVLNSVAQAFGFAGRVQAGFREETVKTAEAAKAANAALASSLADVGKAIAAQIATADKTISDLRASLSALIPELAADAKAIQDASTNAIQAINSQTAARLAGLDKLTNTEREIARQTLEIEKQSATERLKVLNDSSKQILAASNAEATARFAIARSAGENLAKVEREVATSRAATLRQLVAGYTAYLAELTGLETGHLNKIKELQEQRVAINKSVAERIREIRRAELPLYEQYADRVNEIDEQISKARRALALGDLKAAEDFAKRAIDLTSGIATKVESDGQIIVDQYTASQKAVLRLELAQQVLNKTLDERIASEKEGAAETTKSVAKATTELGELQKRLDAINQAVAEGIEIKLDVDTTAVEEAITKLTTATEEREILIGLGIKVDDAKKRIAEIRADLEAGLTVQAQVKLDQVAEAIDTITAAKPELTVQTEAAGKAIGALSTEIAKLAEPVTVAATVKSNVAEVQSAIDNLKKPTFSEHEIRVKRVEVNAAGGLVGEKVAAMRRAWPAAQYGVQQFAGGGPVFRRPHWSKVPGMGDGDTVPAALPEGAFVVRKSASQFYGDGLMAKLARGFAAGGFVSPLLGSSGASPLKGKAKPGSLLAHLGNGGPLFEVISNAFRIFSPLIDNAKTLPRSTTGQNLADYLVAVLNLIRNSDDLEAAAKLLEGVASISGNLMASINTAHKFNVPIVMGMFAPNEKEGTFASTPTSDLYKALVEASKSGAGFPQGTAGRFAAGGLAQGTDTVASMLTPGEYVVNRNRVGQLGVGIMQAINDMRYSREALAGMLRGPAAPQRPRYFEEGGLVGSTSTAPAAPAPTSSDLSVNVAINAQADAILSPDNFRRFILPQIEDAMRRRAN